jgi:uncharacterized LabA/DUF88 family protein
MENENLENGTLPKIAIFIDEANIYHSQKTLGWKVDYLKLKKYFEQQGQITVLNFYTSFLKENGPQNERFEILSNNGFTIIKKKLKFIKNGNLFIKKGNLDIELAIDAYVNKDNYDIFILFSGDSDFECLLKKLRKEGKKIYTFSTKEHISRELISCSDKYFDMKKLKGCLA